MQPTPSPSPSSARHSLGSWAYDQIRARLLAGAFPLDKRISEAGIAAELGISRVPVREAIQRLTREGLLMQRPSSGTYVAQAKAKDLRDIYEVRLALEALAAGKAARRMTDAQIQTLHTHLEAMRQSIHQFRETGDAVLQGPLLQAFHLADRAFHELILSAANNPFARNIVTQGQVKQHVFGKNSHHRDLHHLAWVWIVHARIARAIARRDAKAARHWMQQHIRSSLKDALLLVK